MSLKCQYVFLPEISIELASRLLTNMSLRKGSSVAVDVSFCDDRSESIRPIKDLGEIEVTNYNKFKVKMVLLLFSFY